MNEFSSGFAKRIATSIRSPSKLIPPSACIRVMERSGKFWEKVFKNGTITCIENASDAATRNIPLGLPLKSRTALSASSIDWSIPSQRSNNASPASVRDKALVVRLNNRTPSRSSNRLIFLLTPEAVSPNRRAAPTKLPVSTTSAKTDISPMESIQ